MKPILLAVCCLLLFHAVLSASAAKKQKGQEQCHASAAVQHKLDQAEVFAPSILSIASEISVIQLESPSFRTVETELEKYYRSYSSLINDIEQAYENPAAVTSEGHVEEMTQAHTKLARAISELAYVQLQHSSLAQEQASLQKAMFADASIMTALTQYTDIYHSSVEAATQDMMEADVTEPSLFDQVLHADLAADDDSQLACALSVLSSYEYTLDTSVDKQLSEVISSFYTVSPSVLASLASCYPTAYENAYLLARYVQSHSTLLTAISAYLTAAQKVQSIGSAVAQVVNEEDPTAMQDLSVMQSIYNSWHTMSSALSFEQMLVDSSPLLNSAAKQIQASFYASPSVASLVLLGIEHPSSVGSSSASLLANDEAQHQSLVQAVQYEKQWISDHPQYAAALTSLASNVINELVKHSDLVTVLTSVSQLVSGSTNAASISIANVRSVVPSISDVIGSFESIDKLYPQVQCAELVIASYDTSLPQTVEQIWLGLTNKAEISDISYFTQLTGRYPALMRAFETILSADRYYSGLQAVQSALIQAQKTDSDLLKQWSTYKQALDSITAQVNEYSFSSSSSSSSS